MMSDRKKSLLKTSIIQDEKSGTGLLLKGFDTGAGWCYIKVLKIVSLASYGKQFAFCLNEKIMLNCTGGKDLLIAGT